MSGLSHRDALSELQAQARRQREALEQIAVTCEAVNFPPDLVVQIDTLAREGLRQPPTAALRDTPTWTESKPPDRH